MSDRSTSTILEAISVIFDRDDLEGNDKLIAIYLIRRGALTGQAFPSYATIAKECGLSRATVARTIPKLRDMGILRTEGGGGGRYAYTIIPDGHRSHSDTGRSHSDTAQSHSDTGEQSFADLTVIPDPYHSDTGWSHSDTGPVSPRDRHPKETTKETVKETSKGTGSDPPRDPPAPEYVGDDPVEALVRLYNMYDPVTGGDYVRFTARRYQEMQAALQAGASYELVAQVIKELAATARGPWEVRKEAVRRVKAQSGVHQGDAGHRSDTDSPRPAHGSFAERIKDDPYRGWFSRALSGSD